jgi:hypothetical protein
MNWYTIFYWITVADNVKTVLLTFSIIFTAFTVLCFGIFIIARDGNDLSAQKDGAAERAKKWFWWALPFTLVLFLCWTLIPTKKDALLIVAAGGALEFLTNDSTAKQLPHDLMTFVTGELKVMAKDAQVELKGLSVKEDILNQAKTMTGAQLIEAMKDSTFRNVILNQ